MLVDRRVTTPLLAPPRLLISEIGDHERDARVHEGVWRCGQFSVNSQFSRAHDGLCVVRAGVVAGGSVRGTDALNEGLEGKPLLGVHDRRQVLRRRGGVAIRPLERTLTLLWGTQRGGGFLEVAAYGLGEVLGTAAP